jgi:type IV pilus assembly protein PilM
MKEALVFGGRFSSQIGLLGIDIGHHSVKLLQLQQASSSNDALEILGAGEVELPDVNSHQASDDDDRDTSHAHDAPTPRDQQLAERLRTIFATGRFTGRRCVVALPRHDVHVQSVRLPRMPDSELHQAVIWEAAQRFGMSHDAMEVDFIRTGATLQSGENKEEIIIVAASHETIRRRLGPILQAGFRPVAIDAGFASLARIFSRQFRREADRSHVRAIVEVGSTGSTVIIMRGDQICFCKPLAICGVTFTRAVAEHLNLDPRQAAELRTARLVNSLSRGNATDAQSHDPATDRAIYEAVRPVVNELVKEVNLCLRYFGVTFRGKPPSQIILTGGDGLEPRLADAIERGCKITVTHDDPSDTLAAIAEGIQRICQSSMGAAMPSRRSVSPGCWGVAAGLSLRGIAAGGQSIVNRLFNLFSGGAKAEAHSVKEAA